MKSAKPIQIIKKENGSFQLKLDELEPILDSDDLKNRNVVIVSIAGDLRKGKSYLLNFFLKYLVAQYKNHDITDWIGENKKDDEMEGFHFRGGQEADTQGIWMWSEIFTYDRDDGEKFAIILLDTQGIFDNESTMKDCIAIFAISMMMSSIQLFNVMCNYQENDLQHLHLFTEYGVLIMSSKDEKPFQKFIFVVRDWPYPYQNEYGYSDAITEQKLTETEKQPDEMRVLRKRVRSSINNVQTFLMPHPGQQVLEENFKGKLRGINDNFIKCVKLFVPSILAPENLTVRQIHGRKMRICDFKTHLRAYVDAFNRSEIPTPQSLAMANATAILTAIYYDCLKLYIDLMHKEFDQTESYFDEIALQKIHNTAKDKALTKFRARPKLGDGKFISRFEESLEQAINREHVKFCEKNDRRENSLCCGPFADVAVIGIGTATGVSMGTVSGFGIGAVAGLATGIVAGGFIAVAFGIAAGYATKKTLEFVNCCNKQETKKKK